MNILITKPALYETTPVEVAFAHSFRAEFDAVLTEMANNEARIAALQVEIERLRLILEEDEKWLMALRFALE